MQSPPPIPGRGTPINPPNRFQPLAIIADEAWNLAEDPAPTTRFLKDISRTIIARNQSPDIGFDASINPYRGCEHGCIYCYARISHEFLGFSAGLDFESNILVKADAPELLRRELSSPRWKPQVIAMSGVTDPYQPVERRLKLTRRCLAVLAEFRNPVSIITKNYLITRDVDVLKQLAAHSAAAVCLSVTTLDPELTRIMEPRTATPARRLAAIRILADAGVPVGVMVAPIIPGLTDHEIPSILAAAAQAGARHAGHQSVRLPMAVGPLFEQWLTQHFPDRKDKVLNRIRDVHGGKLNTPDFGSRMRSQGIFADHIRQMFNLACRKSGISTQWPALSTEAFRRVSQEPQLFD